MRRRTSFLRAWTGRAVGGLLLYAILEVSLTLTHFEPDAARLALLVAVCVAAAGLLVEGLTDARVTWPLHTRVSVVPPGSDSRLGAYVRLLEDHLTARTPDGGLRDRLVALSGGRLAEELSGPPRRLTRAEIDDYLRRIEEQ